MFTDSGLASKVWSIQGCHSRVPLTMCEPPRPGGHQGRSDRHHLKHILLQPAADQHRAIIVPGKDIRSPHRLDALRHQ